MVDPAQHPGPGVGHVDARPGRTRAAPRPGESGCRPCTPNAALISAASSASRRGGPTGCGGRRAARAAARRGCRHARAARRGPSRHRSARRPTRRRPAAGTGRDARSRRCGRSWSAYTSGQLPRSPGAGGPDTVSKSAPWPRPGRLGRRAAADRAAPAARCSRAQAAASERGSPQRPAWPSSSASVSSTSWQRRTRTPARSSAGIDLGGGRPDPARVLGRLARGDGRPGDRRPGGARRQRPSSRRPPSPPVGHHRHQHGIILTPGYDILGCHALRRAASVARASRSHRHYRRPAHLCDLTIRTGGVAERPLAVRFPQVKRLSRRTSGGAGIPLFPLFLSAK